MHKALPFAFALLGIVLYVLLGRGGDDAPDESVGSTLAGTQQAGADTPAEPGLGPVPERPLIESASASLTAPPVPTPVPAPAGADAPTGGAPSAGAGSPGTPDVASAGTPSAPEPRPARALGEELGPRGGALADSRCRVGLNRLFLARSIENREPVRVGTRFSSDDVPVYAYLDVNNDRGPEQDVIVRWDHLGSDHTYVQHVSAGASPRWRTWIYHTMRRPLAGNWHVRVTDQAGCTIGELYFEATEYQGS